MDVPFVITTLPGDSEIQKTAKIQQILFTITSTGSEKELAGRALTFRSNSTGWRLIWSTSLVHGARIPPNREGPRPMHSTLSLVYRELASLVIIVTDINFKSSVCRDVEGGRSAACLSESASWNSINDMGSWLTKRLGAKYDVAVKDVSVRTQAAKLGQCTP